jgi:uncharacterized DUF497 family protein
VRFEWNDKKSRTNETKHGINFDAARDLWNDNNRVEIHTSYALENRSIVIGRIEKKLWTAIFTQRGEAIRLISVRSARKKEAKLYGQKEIG